MVKALWKFVLKSQIYGYTFQRTAQLFDIEAPVDLKSLGLKTYRQLIFVIIQPVHQEINPE